MCESTAFLLTGKAETLLMENVASVTPVGPDRYLLVGLLGDRMEVSGHFEKMDLMAHRIVFSKPTDQAA